MRKLVLLAAAVPLLFTPTALATAGADTKASCPPPEISHFYDQERLAINARLRATDCPSRENSEFMLAAQITRFDEFGPTSRVERAVMCGPFPTMADLGRDDSESYFYCEVAVALDHPTVETIHYDIDVATRASTRPATPRSSSAATRTARPPLRRLREGDGSETSCATPAGGGGGRARFDAVQASRADHGSSRLAAARLHAEPVTTGASR